MTHALLDGAGRSINGGGRAGPWLASLVDLTTFAHVAFGVARESPRV